MQDELLISVALMGIRAAMQCFGIHLLTMRLRVTHNKFCSGQNASPQRRPTLSPADYPLSEPLYMLFFLSFPEELHLAAADMEM